METNLDMCVCVCVCVCTSLVVQWLRIHLAMQGTWVQPLIGKLRSYMLQGVLAHTPQLVRNPNTATQTSHAAIKTQSSQKVQEEPGISCARK